MTIKLPSITTNADNKNITQYWQKLWVLKSTDTENSKMFVFIDIWFVKQKMVKIKMYIFHGEFENEQKKNKIVWTSLAVIRSPDFQ